jgi:hypothetical protein
MRSTMPYSSTSASGKGSVNDCSPSLPARPGLVAPAHEREVARHEGVEAGLPGQEVGGIEAVLVEDDARGGVQGGGIVGRIGIGRAAFVKAQQHLVQPVAPVALVEPGLDLVGGVQAQHRVGEEAVGAAAQGLERRRREAGGNEAGRDRLGAAHRGRRHLDRGPRIVPRAKRRAPGRRARGEAARRAGWRQRLGAVAGPAQQG